MDDEEADFYRRVREAYLEIAALEPERFRTVNAALSLEEIHAQVSALVTDFLENRKAAPQNK
jgi:dTMP kinase